jgi:DNA-binding response OmpR family regulator
MNTESRHNALLVDSDRDVREPIQSGLERRGFSVTVFSDPDEAISHFQVNHYDKIFLDIKMPGTTAFELAKKMWTKDPDAKICFVSEVEIHENEARMMFKDLKNVQFIKKPITPGELAECIAESLRQS